jgi:hypothetical protein
MGLSAPRSKFDVEPERLDFRAVVRRTSPRLFRLALRLIGNDADASDVLQEGYLRAFRAIGRLGARPDAELDAWLYAVVTHAALNWLRDRKRTSRREREASTPAPPDASGVLEARDVLRKLQALLVHGVRSRVHRGGKRRQRCRRRAAKARHCRRAPGGDPHGARSEDVSLSRL